MEFFKYINERGGHSIVSELNAPAIDFGSIKEMFENSAKMN